MGRELGFPEQSMTFFPKYKVNRNEPRRKKTCLRWFANNKGADQPAHPRSLVSTFVIRLLESYIYELATSKIPIY